MTAPERASRQSFLGETSDVILATTRVAIVGSCGGGSPIAQQLAHIGVGHFLLFDADHVEEPNLNRMIGSQPCHARSGALKVDVIRDMILAIAPGCDVVAKPTRWQASHELIRECDLVFGCVDTLLGRDELERYCRRYLIPYIDIGMDVTKVGRDYAISGQIITSMPGGPCMRCLGFLTDDLLAKEVQGYGAAGPRPQVVWPNAVLAATAVGVFMKLRTPWTGSRRLDPYIQYDGNNNLLQPKRLADIEPQMGCRHFSSLDSLGDAFWQG